MVEEQWSLYRFHEMWMCMDLDDGGKKNDEPSL